MLIGITGPAFSGKDTIANHLCLTHGYFTCEAFADPLRDGLSALFGLFPHHFDAKHKETVIEWIGKSPRELLQTLGTQWGAIWSIGKSGAGTCTGACRNIRIIGQPAL